MASDTTSSRALSSSPSPVMIRLDTPPLPHTTSYRRGYTKSNSQSTVSDRSSISRQSMAQGRESMKRRTQSANIISPMREDDTMFEYIIENSPDSKSSISPNHTIIQSQIESDTTNEYNQNSTALLPSNSSPGEVRSGFARIYYENQSFTASTVFKLCPKTTVLEVRTSMASKIKISDADFDYFVIVVIFPTNTIDQSATYPPNDSSLSARTLQDNELLLPLVEKLNRARSSSSDSIDTFLSEASSPSISSPHGIRKSRSRLKRRSKPPVKFLLKDIRGAPLDLEEQNHQLDGDFSAGTNHPKPPLKETMHYPSFLGSGIRSGYLQKRSDQDSNVWRKHWFIVKDDQLLYCKSATNQRDVKAISLLDAYLNRSSANSLAFELRTSLHTYHLCASSKNDLVGWCTALHVQIAVSAENRLLYDAEMELTECAVAQSELEFENQSYTQPSLLEQVLGREDTLKIFRDYVYSVKCETLLDVWIQCEIFRRSCVERMQGTKTISNDKTNGKQYSSRATLGKTTVKKSASEEWEHLKMIANVLTKLVPFIGKAVVDDLKAWCRQNDVRTRRLRLAGHPMGDKVINETDAFMDEMSALPSNNLQIYPSVEYIIPAHQKLFEVIEKGPFRQFISQNGYRLLLERVMGRTV